MSGLVIVFSCHVKSCLVFSYADCGDADDADEDDDLDDDDDVDNEGCGNRDLHVTPTTVKSGDPVVTLDSFPTLGAFPCCVSLHLAENILLTMQSVQKKFRQGGGVSMVSVLYHQCHFKDYFFFVAHILDFVLDGTTK